MSSLLLDGRGVQAPRVLSAPPRVASSGPEVVDLAASAGLILDPWQCADLEVACGEQADGRWAAFEVALLNQRQNGKGAELQARQLAGLFLFGERLQTHTAHRVDTCLEHFLRMKELITGTPDLSRRLRKITETNGAEAIHLMSGQRLIFKARSKGSGRGFSGSSIYLDEAFYLLSGGLAGMLYTMGAQPNPQLWYASSPTLMTPESAVLRKVCKRGRAGTSPRLAFIEYSADPKAETDDPGALRQANPALGYRLTVEMCQNERDATPDEEEYRRERLGIWLDPDEADLAPKVIPLDRWDACLDPTSSPAAPVFAFDVSPDRSSSCIAAGGVNGDGLRHVEVTGRPPVMDHRPGTGWLVGRLVEILGRAPGATVVVDATGPAGSLLPDLRAALHVAEVDATVREVTLVEHKQAVGQFYDAAMEGRLAHLGQPGLLSALTGADKRPMGDAWLWSRRRSTVDITPLVAATLAAWAVGVVVEPKESDFFLI